MRIPGTGLTFMERESAYGAATAQAAPSGAGTAGRASAGSDGLSIFTDLMPGGQDANPEMSGQRKYVIFDEMRKSDSAVKSALFMYKLPIRRTKWIAAPASDDGIDQLIHDAVQWQFGLGDHDGQLDLSWDEWLQQSMQFLDFGSMGEEMVEGDLMIWRPTGDDGTNSRLIRPFARFAPRFPGTVEYLEDDKQTGRITRIKQNLPGTDWIPGDRLAWYAPDRAGGTWYGDSLLRPMYSPWKLKSALIIAAGIGWDRYAYGTPIVRYPTGSGKRHEAEKIGRDFRTHERSWIAFEGPKPQAAGMDGWDIEIADMASTIGDPTPLIKLYNEMISEAALQQFSRLGTTHSGARSVGEVLIEPFYQAINAYADYLAGQRRRVAFRRFIDINFGEQYATPTLKPTEVRSKNALQMAQAISLLASAGFNFADRSSQNDIRDRVLDMGPLPDGVQEAIDGLPDEVGLEGEGLNLPAAA